MYIRYAQKKSGTILNEKNPGKDQKWMLMMASFIYRIEIK